MHALRKHLPTNIGTILAIGLVLALYGAISCGSAAPTPTAGTGLTGTDIPLPTQETQPIVPPIVEGDLTVTGKLTVNAAGIFGSPGVGEGGEIQLAQGEEGPRWVMDNMRGNLRWFNMVGATSAIVLKLSPDGILDLTGTLQAGGANYMDGLVLRSPDLVIKADASWGRGAGGRALIHGQDNTLILNYDEDFDGGVQVHGAFQSGRIIESGLQTPEEQKTATIERFALGDVLCWDAPAGRLEKCAELGSPLVVAVADSRGKPIVLGAEPVRVLGPVRPGDLLVASDVPGYAVAWSQVGSDPAPVGCVIAKALESLDGERGLIQAMILNQ